MITADLLGAFSALAASISWGGGDFSGGFASRRLHPFQVLTLSAAIGVIPLIVLLIFVEEGLPSLRAILLAGAAGVAGTLGLAAFYRGLVEGRSAVVAPVASVIGAMIPVLVGMAQAGFPTFQRLAGFAIGLIGIWLVTQEQPIGGVSGKPGLRSAVLAGLGFGGFLTLIAQVGPNELYGPLIASKMSGLVLSWIWLWRMGLPVPGVRANPVAGLAGLLDTAGNIFYLLSAHLTRLDIAAALSSLYPAGTVLLAWLLLKERISPRQWLGVMAALAAIVLITV
ncbi:MAG: EamA family transporter [Anaerolineales bacterium]